MIPLGKALPQQLALGIWSTSSTTATTPPLRNLTRSVTLLTTLPLLKNAAQVICEYHSKSWECELLDYQQKTIEPTLTSPMLSVTLTVQTQTDPDQQLQKETKALLTLRRGTFRCLAAGRRRGGPHASRMPASVVTLSQ